MPRYRFLFFNDEHGASTLDNPLHPMPTPDTFDGLAHARLIAWATAQKMKAGFVVIEDDDGNVIERWRGNGGNWEPIHA
jgi:hypothetical protein